MQRLIDIAGRENVYYMVTDSMFVNQEGYDRLAETGGVVGNDIGQLGVDNYGDTGNFTSIHHWQLGQQSRNGSRKLSSRVAVPCIDISNEDHVGVHPTDTEFGGSITTVETKFTGIRGVLKSDDKDSVTISRVFKTYRRGYDRGRVLPNGRTIPLNAYVEEGRTILEGPYI
jgi:hypothetical protein